MDVLWSDIPYGINYSGGRTQTVAKKNYGKIQGDIDENISGFVQCCINIPAKDYWICCSPINSLPALIPFKDIGGLDGIIIWKKNRPGLGYQWIRRYCEFILFKSYRKKPKAESSEFDYWEISIDNPSEYVHGTQKPVALIKRSFNLSPGKLVADPFLGSGSTMIACEQTGRICYGMEIDPIYCDVIIKRWQDFTGGKAKKIK